VTSSGVPGLVAPPGPVPADRPGRWRAASLRERALQLVRFGSVGTVAFVVDMGTYNLLRFGPVDLLHGKPLTARIVAVLLATLVSWLGNRHWVFADRRTSRHGRELALFTAINVVGIGITVGTLAFWHQVLGSAGPVADNVANVVGIVLGTIVRYVGYQLFVFTGTATVPTALAEVGHESRTHAAVPLGTVPHPRATGGDAA
jgi:putative flippase GtrA